MCIGLIVRKPGRILTGSRDVSQGPTGSWLPQPRSRRAEMIWLRSNPSASIVIFRGVDGADRRCEECVSALNLLMDESFDIGSAQLQRR